ncbi:Cna protein B-type domain protein [Candidatus Sulfotelmatomonas gaucii]|uniref:Cna protein B-type domain protein n=1 Tax=Candidatus Sulfuritelmatomonas gaucii TaxID=2043161 RepID=A0A2N9LA87_9BACT|nr:Cna protein B-type domain protein [Candidatus Sulfotelmatomonas gaucii]
MKIRCGATMRVFPLIVMLFGLLSLHAQSGSAGTLHGTVTDPSGAVVPGATVHLTHATSGFSRTATTDATGQFSFSNVPFDPYQLEVSARGFASLVQITSIDSAVGTNLNLVLQIAGASQTVMVESQGPLVEDTSTYHTDVDRDLFNKVPLESASSTLSSLVTETAPGVSADSNGLFHGLGDHASNSFSVDGQPITDQQSKVFSNQLPSNAVQSLEVIEGAPPAQYGDKTSLVIVATTRSGQGVTKPTGDISASYGAFGSATGGFNLAYGGQNWGNFVEMDGLNTGRFLDPPEFSVFHARGNEENIFDRIDYSFTSADSVHLDLNNTRSWFQNPNSFDNLNVQNVIAGGASANPTFGDVGNTDQRSQIETYNIAPTYTRVLSNSAVLNFSVYTRRDGYHYYPSNNPLADLGPADLQTSSIAQYRTLTNTGTHADYTWVRGRQNVLAGIQYEQTFLREHDNFGVVDSTLNSPCVDASGNMLPGYANPSQCPNGGASGPNANPAYLSVLAPYDLTRGGSYYPFFGHTDVKELALYIEDKIKLGNWNLNLGIRGDKYNGLTSASQAEPRLGVAYNIKPTNTVASISYARTLETPFNENLVLSSQGCADFVLSPILLCTSGVQGILQPGYRNEFHASFQQGFGKYLVVSGEYIWKYTHNAFDFAVLGNTPIFFPIDWHNSKIPGYALHAEVPNLRGFSAYFDGSSVAARFFPPQVAGAGATVGQTGLPFRIDHDENFNQTSHLQYTLSRDDWWNGLWGGFNWRYDSGLVAGNAPCYGTTDPNSPCLASSTILGGQSAISMVNAVGIPLTADQQFQAGFMCAGQKAAPTSPLPSVCPANEFSSSLINIPAPNTGDNDHNPQRIAPRSLFDVSLGKSNIFHKEHYKTDLDFTAINVINKYALYNFLSTFSGTHYVTPRAMTAKITVNF